VNYLSIFDERGVHITTQRFDTATTEVRLAAGKSHRLVVAVRDPVSESIGIASREVRY